MLPLTSSAKFPIAGTSIESRPITLQQSLARLRDRLMNINVQANDVCRVLCGPTVNAAETQSGPAADLGLYSNLFQLIENCNELCEQIENSLIEAVR